MSSRLDGASTARSASNFMARERAAKNLSALLLLLSLFAACTEEETLSSTLDRDLQKGRHLAERGNDLLKQGRSQRALTTFQQAAELLPDNAEVLFRLGVAHAQLEQHDEAIATFERALAADSTKPTLFFALGSSLHARQRHAEAGERIQRAIELAPDRPHYHFRLGNV